MEEVQVTTTQERRLQLFFANVQEMKSGFTWHSTMMKHMAALIYTAEDRVIDNDTIRRSYNMMKENTGLFSMFRGNSALNIAAMLSRAGDREKQLSNTLQVYDALKAAQFRASDYLAIAAYMIASGTDADGIQSVIRRMRTFYDGMKSLHPILTSYDDYIFSAMLGLSDVGTDTGVARMEELYCALKPDFRTGNGVQALTQVLVLGNQTSEAVERVLALRRKFRNLGMRMENQYTLPSLGILALLPGTVDELAGEVAETFGYLRTIRGFSSWSFPKQELMLYATALASYEHVGAMSNSLVTTALTTSITNIIIAQHAAVAAAAASTAVVAAT